MCFTQPLRSFPCVAFETFLCKMLLLNEMINYVDAFLENHFNILMEYMMDVIVCVHNECPRMTANECTLNCFD